MKLPLIVRCPVCAAGPGDPCRNRNGRPSKQIHSARRDELSMQRLFASTRPRIRWRNRPEGRVLLERAVGQPCPLCSRLIRATIVAEIDHIIPFGLGGIDEPRNLRAICTTCNRTRPKAGRDLDLETSALAEGLLQTAMSADPEVIV